MDVNAVYIAYLIHRYGLRDHTRYHKETYAQWITIGGRPEGEKKHAGGTPVKVDEHGRIQAGPAALKGKTISELKHPNKQLRMFGLPPEPAAIDPRKRKKERVKPDAVQGILPGFEEVGPREPKQPPGAQIIPYTVEKLPDGRVKGHALLSRPLQSPQFGQKPRAVRVVRRCQPALSAIARRGKGRFELGLGKTVLPITRNTFKARFVNIAQIAANPGRFSQCRSSSHQRSFTKCKLFSISQCRRIHSNNFSGLTFSGSRLVM